MILTYVGPYLKCLQCFILTPIDFCSHNDPQFLLMLFLGILSIQKKHSLGWQSIEMIKMINDNQIQ